MVRVGPEVLERLQKDADSIRNICILAHVDHGKTSLSDSLLASNGIISQRLAGKIRYLDAREDEQLRGITMESSAISLYFRVLHKQEGKEEPLVNEHLINLIDSPGHIDFSGEVSAASRLCDGAVVLVDVVEGVCSQTITVLRQCWTEKLKPILVLNKMDRLVTELRLTPQEAYVHLNKIIEMVNSIIASFFNGERSLNDLSWREQLEYDQTAQFVDDDDSDIYFNPAKNNVVFSSAVDGWGFSISQLAKFYAHKLGAKRENLQKVLWGDFYMEPKTKKIVNGKGLKGRNLKPLFVTLILDNIWKIYENIVLERNLDVLEKIISALNIKISPRDLHSKDHKVVLRTVMSQWLPVSTSILLTVIDRLPSPSESQLEKATTLVGASPGKELVDDALMEGMKNCDRDAPVCAFVSKMLSIPKEELPLSSDPSAVEDYALMERRRKARQEALKAAKAAEMVEKMSKKRTGDKKSNDFFERVNDTVATPLVRDGELGKIKSKSSNEAIANGLEPMSDFESDQVTGDPETFVPQEIDPSDPMAAMFEYEEEDVFAVDQSPCGDELECEEETTDDGNEVLIGFARIYSGTLKVGQTISVLGPKYNPRNPSEHIQSTKITALYIFMGKELVPLKECPPGNIVGIGGLAGRVLKSGTLVDPSVRGCNLASVSQHVTPIVKVALEPAIPTQMSKLERGLKLLEQADPCVETYVEDSGERILCTAGELHLERCLKDLKERFAGINITASEPAIPYRETFVQTSEMNPPKNSTLGRGVQSVTAGKFRIAIRTVPLPEPVVKLLIDREEDIKKMVATGKEVYPFSDSYANLMEALNDLFAKASQKDVIWENCSHYIAAFGGKKTGPNLLVSKNGDLRKVGHSSAEEEHFEYESSIINGFELAVNEGPLSKEPVQGMCVILDNVSEVSGTSCEVDMANIAGKLITATRDAIHSTFLDWSPRIMWAMYSCDIQASVEVLGRVYGVVQQRRGRITSEEMKEGTPLFQIEAKVPVVEAFGFSEDIKKKTSGAALPQLVFSGFECIDLDPFWVPTTEEELEDLGDIADKENIARKHMNMIRRRKGLFIDEKVIKNAEKQRTLKRS
ncbi:LAMI_0B00562g1_1 [Lachancea mirantina]|uniref:Ribosome assembly protein 1 n=1 Tax=Lachancea mirantina TaxID=1230905 RepID=A0A1G4ITK4_9SACH|nr:LAMI_0B00562g1_1 [Lachancea mirantina]